MANVSTASTQIYTANNFTLGGSSSVTNNNIVFTTNHADITFNIGLAPPAFTFNSGTSIVTFTLGGSNINAAAVSAMNGAGIHPQGLFDLKSINFAGSLKSAHTRDKAQIDAQEKSTGPAAEIEVGGFEKLDCDPGADNASCN
jgi:hypothetical protein